VYYDPKRQDPNGQHPIRQDPIGQDPIGLTCKGLGTYGYVCNEMKYKHSVVLCCMYEREREREGWNGMGEKPLG